MLTVVYFAGRSGVDGPTDVIFEPFDIAEAWTCCDHIHRFLTLRQKRLARQKF